MASKDKAAERKTGVAAWNESRGNNTQRPEGGKAARQRKAEADKRRRLIILALLGIVCIASLVCAWPLKERITRGLWLRGGKAAIVHVESAEGKSPSQEDINQVIGTMKNRLAALDVCDATALQEGGDTVLVEVPEFEDVESVANLIAGQGKLEFVLADDMGDADALAKINAGSTNVELTEGTYTAFLDGTHVASVSLSELGRDYYMPVFSLDEEGTKILAKVSKERAADAPGVYLVLDGRVVATASISQEITDGEWSFFSIMNHRQARALQTIADEAPLEAKLTRDGTKKVGPVLGKTGLWGLAIGAGVVYAAACIVAFKLYKKLAVLVAGGLAVFSIVMLGLMALASRVNDFVLTVPGVLGGLLAAALTFVALMMVSGRFCEKVSHDSTVKGASLSAVRDGLMPLVAPVAAAGVAAVVLTFVPFANARDFGVVLVIGMVCGFIAVFWFGVTMLRYLAGGTIQADPEAWGAKPKSAKEDLENERSES